MLLEATTNPNTLTFLAEIAKQGPLFSLLALVVYVLYKRQQKMEADAAARAERLEQAAAQQAKKLEDYMTDDREKLMVIIENNSRLVEENTRVMAVIEVMLKTK